MSKSIITRFAPSPTGLFHIGSARTALFNYLFAKKNQGKFILRIEDTDPVRSKKEFENDILNGMKWLGLNWDGQIFYQSKRKEIYQKYAQKLIDQGYAYKKDGAIWFNLKSKILNLKSEIIKYTDLILEKIEFNIDQFHDFVLIKKNGMPLYMFAATIDDHAMGVTHVIRGADHVNSTPQQIMLYNALDFSVPEFGHIPLILNPDKSKMSKRKNLVSVTSDFRDKGYLPEAMINYLTLLGWNPKDEREFFSLQELEKEFDIKKVNKSPAIFDIDKLNYFNNHYIQQKSDDELLDLITQNVKIKTKNNNLKLKNKTFILKIISVIKERMNKLSEFEGFASFFFLLPEYKKDLLIFKKSTQEKTLKGLHATYYILHATPSSKWQSKDELNKILLEIVKNDGLNNGDVFWPVRVALSGLDKSPSPPELLWVLGKDESIKRIELGINKLK